MTVSLEHTWNCLNTPPVSPPLSPPYSSATFATSSVKLSLKTTSTCGRRFQTISRTNWRSSWSVPPGSNRPPLASRSKLGTPTKWPEEWNREKSSTHPVIWIFVFILFYISVYLTFYLSIYLSIFLYIFLFSYCFLCFQFLLPSNIFNLPWYRRLHPHPTNCEAERRWKSQISANTRRTWVWHISNRI